MPTKPLWSSVNLYATQVNVHAATEAQRLSTRIRSLIVPLSAYGRRKSTLPLRCACAQSSIEALTTREEDLRSEVALLETVHAVQVERSRARVGHILGPLAARKLLEVERDHLS